MLSFYMINPPEISYPIPSPPASMTVCPTTTPTPCSPIPLQWGIEPSWIQGLLLPLMPNKDILCYTYGCSYRFLHVYSLFGGIDTGLLILLFFLWD